MDDLEGTRPTRVAASLAVVQVPLDSGYVVTNGPAFSPDALTFYALFERVVYAFDPDTSGALSGRRVFVRIEDRGGFPDGTSVDAEGCVWVALWGAAFAGTHLQVGELLSRIRVPCANVTKMAFGGPDYRSAFVTTA